MADEFLGGFRSCAKCAITKPWTFDYFRSYSNRGVCSLRWTCRSCQGLGEGLDRRNRRGPLSEEDRRTAKARYNRTFYEKDPDHVRELWRLGAARNRERRSEYAKRYRAENSEKVKADNKRWRLKNAERIKLYMREYSPKWSELNADKRRAAVKRWRVKHPQKAHHSTQAYWARKKGAEGRHSFAEQQALLKSQRNLCFYCGTKLAKYHVDHFVPLSRGGTDYIENIRIACPTCNCRKSDKMPWEWMPKRFSAP